MRIHVDDEAARLRLSVSEIKCSEEPDGSAPMESDEHPSQKPECLDCGEHIVACRCSPGEG